MIWIFSGLNSFGSGAGAGCPHSSQANTSALAINRIKISSLKCIPRVR
jgi:hypothetical protein